MSGELETKNVADPEPCGCVGLGAAIHFCPFHKSTPQLYAALMYPRFGDTAGLLEKIADDLDRNTQEGWTHLYTRHLRAAAKDMRSALASARGVAETLWHFDLDEVQKTSGLYGSVGWAVEDIIEHRRNLGLTEWSESEALRWLQTYDSQIAEAVTQEGWNQLETLMTIIFPEVPPE